MKKGNIARIIIIGIVLIWIIINYPSFSPIPELTSKIIKEILTIIEIDSLNYGRYLIVTFNGVDRIFELSSECSGIILFSVFLLGIFLIPKINLKYRMLALFFIPIIFITNLFRIILSIIIAKNYSTEMSIFFHNTLGQVLIFGVTILSYILILKIFKKFPSENEMNNF